RARGVPGAPRTQASESHEGAPGAGCRTSNRAAAVTWPRGKPTSCGLLLGERELGELRLDGRVRARRDRRLAVVLVDRAALERLPPAEEAAVHGEERGRVAGRVAQAALLGGERE